MKKEYGEPIDKAFYDREPVIVARELLGKYLARNLKDRKLIGKIIETEAYPGLADPASHSYKGKTDRNEVLFGEAGYTYIYSIHRYFCLDIVTESKNIPSSVLIRALLPIQGLKGQKFDGPGKLCLAMSITRELNGIDVTYPNSPIVVLEGEGGVDSDIVVSRRVGVTKAQDSLLRFQLKANV